MSKNKNKRAKSAGKYADMIVAGATAKTPKQVQATLALRAGGGHGAHDNRPARQRTRATALAAALRD